MGSKQKPAIANDSDTTSGVVVSPSAPGPLQRLWAFCVAGWRRLDRRVQIGLTALAVIVLAVILFLVFHHPAPVNKGPRPNVDNNYGDTDLKNLPILLSYDYDLTENNIMHGNLHKELKSFQEAHDVALAIARLGNRSRALDAYKIAVSKAPRTTNETFYVEVMGVSYQVGDKAYAEKMYQKARSIIEDSDRQPDDKKVALAHLDGLYTATKEGEN